jgi:hypothetical protein
VAILAISHITSDERTDAGTGGEKVTVGKPRHPSPPGLLICVAIWPDTSIPAVRANIRGVESEHVN